MSIHKKSEPLNACIMDFSVILLNLYFAMVKGLLMSLINLDDVDTFRVEYFIGERMADTDAE